MVFLYILLAIFIFGLMIMIHELGHFLTARVCGIGVNEFSIGMGPKIFSRVSKKSGICYSLRAFPIGGFVSMVGEDEESDADNAFDKVNVFKRMLVVIAGAFMNLLLGLIIVFVIVVSSKYLPSTVVAQFDENAVSNSYGLQLGDKIVKVDKTRIHNGYDLSYQIMNKGYKALDLTVIRNGEKIVLEDVVFDTFDESGATFGELDFKVSAMKKTFGRVIGQTWFRAVSTVRMVWDSLFDLIRGRYGLQAVSGPVGITGVIGDAAKMGITSLLNICAVIAINLGVVNLLPLPALDGGRLVFLIIEAIRGKRVNKEIEGKIHFIGIVVLLAFMLLITLKDVWGIFKR